MHLSGIEPEGQIVVRSKFLLFPHPVLFSYMVKAVLVETLCSPLHTRRAIIAAIVVPTGKKSSISARKIDLSSRLPYH